jgi:hypothetical protein
MFSKRVYTKLTNGRTLCDEFCDDVERDSTYIIRFVKACAEEELGVGCVRTILVEEK